MEELVARLARPELRLRTMVIEGAHVASTLGGVADADPDSLVVLAAHGFSPMSGWPSGRIPSGLVTHAAAPVLILQDMPVAAEQREELGAAPQRRSRSWRS